MSDADVLQQANQMAKQGLISPEQFNRIASKFTAQDDGQYDPFAAEKFANPAIDGLVKGAAKLDFSRPTSDPSDPVIYRTAGGNITQGDIDKATHVAMSAGPGATVRPYTNVQDSLMGFRKAGPQKAFDETNFPHVQNVEVTLPKTSIAARDTFRDQIKGMNPDHALERAYRNWPDAIHIRAVD